MKIDTLTEDEKVALKIVANEYIKVLKLDKKKDRKKSEIRRILSSAAKKLNKKTE